MWYLSPVGHSYRFPTEVSYIPTGLRRLAREWTRGPWISSLVPCIYMCWNEGLHRCLPGRPRTSPSILYIRICNTVTFALEQILHIFPTELYMPPPPPPPHIPLLHLDVFFVTCDKQVKLSKCIYPKETISFSRGSNPLQRMWCLHLPHLPLPYVCLSLEITPRGKEGHRVIRQGGRFKRCLLVYPLWIQFFASRWDGWNCLTYSTSCYFFTFHPLYTGTSS